MFPSPMIQSFLVIIGSVMFPVPIKTGLLSLTDNQLTIKTVVFNFKGSSKLIIFLIKRTRFAPLVPGKEGFLKSDFCYYTPRHLLF